MKNFIQINLFLKNCIIIQSLQIKSKEISYNNDQIHKMTCLCKLIRLRLTLLYKKFNLEPFQFILLSVSTIKA